MSQGIKIPLDFMNTGRIINLPDGVDPQDAATVAQLGGGGGGAVTSVNGATGVVVLDTDDINEATNLYFTQARVLSTILAGLSATNSTILATDTILQAFNKAQGQISDIIANYLPLSGGTLSGFLNLHADPTNALHAATKSYIDNLLTGITWKQEVRAATTGNITLSGLQTIDGISSLADARYLVKNQTTQTENGIYLMKSGAWVRTDDANTTLEIETATVLVRLGTLNHDTQWTCTNANEPVIGTDAITFGQISAGGTYTNGTYLKLVGNVFDIDFTTFTTANVVEGSSLYFTNARAIAATLTGYVSGAGAITSADSILSAIQKLDGTSNVLATQIGTIQVGNNLFNYYNFR
jgi:hypothetical protein